MGFIIFPNGEIWLIENMTIILHNHVCIQNESQVIQGLTPMTGQHKNFITIAHKFLTVDIFI